MLFFAAGQFDRVEQHAAQGLSRWQAHLLAIFLCRRLSARRWACAKIRQTMPCPAPTWPPHRPAPRTAPALCPPGSRPRRAPPCAHLTPAPPCAPPCAHLDPAPRQPCAPHRAQPHPRHLQKPDAVTQNTRRPARKPCAVSGFTRYSGPMPCVQSSAAAFVHADLHTSFYKTVAFTCAAARRCACRPVWFSLGMSQFWSPHRAGLLFTSMALINNFKK